MFSVGNLRLDLENYRHGKQANQKNARDAIIAEQGKKLVKLALAEDIAPMVIDAEDGNQNFIVVEGNRRLAAIAGFVGPSVPQAFGSQIGAKIAVHNGLNCLQSINFTHAHSNDLRFNHRNAPKGISGGREALQNNFV